MGEKSVTTASNWQMKRTSLDGEVLFCSWFRLVDRDGGSSGYGLSKCRYQAIDILFGIEVVSGDPCHAVGKVDPHLVCRK